VWVVNDPVYYENEINVYNAEMDEITDVSQEYQDEREFLLWRHEETLEVANQYYDK